jgi:hypothetical protein
MAWWKHLVKSAKEAQSQDDDDGEHFPSLGTRFCSVFLNVCI